jgi:VanZ family protein
VSGVRVVPYRTLRLLLALVYAAFIFGFGVADLGPFPVPVGVPLDKLEHLLAFGGFAWVVELSLLELSPFRRRALAVLTSSSAGLLLELVQSALPHRAAELLDLVADVLGALLAVGISTLVSFRLGQRGNAAAAHRT